MNKPRFTGENVFAVRLDGAVLSNYYSAEAAQGFLDGLAFLNPEKYQACTVDHLVGLYEDVAVQIPAAAFEAAVKLAQDAACQDLAQALLSLYPEWDDLSWENQERLFKGFIAPEPEPAPKPLYEPCMPERYVPASRIPWLETPVRMFPIDRPYVVEGTPVSAAYLALVDDHAMRPQGAGRGEAVKLVRASTGLDLKQALGLVDTIWRRREDQELGAYHSELLAQQ